VSIKKATVTGEMIENLEKERGVMPPKYRPPSVYSSMEPGEYAPPIPTFKQALEAYDFGVEACDAATAAECRLDFPVTEIPRHDIAVEAAERTEEITARIAKIEKLLKRGFTGTTPLVEDSITPDEATALLQEVVLAFNIKLKEWYELTGCVVNFGWRYDPERYLDILGIDHIIFRKDPPSEKSIREVLDKVRNLPK